MEIQLSELPWELQEKVLARMEATGDSFSQVIHDAMEAYLAQNTSVVQNH